MIEQEITIINKLGLHARAAAKLVATASQFSSNVSVERNGRTINGKSIMGVMLLAAAKGTNIRLIIDGGDEEEALNQISLLIKDRFGEKE